MRYYNPTTTTSTTYTTYEAPEDRAPIDWRPSLEKGEDTHVRDCMTWHSPSPRYTYRNHNYRMYTHDGRDYWTSRDCGNPLCRSCLGEDIMVDRDVGYVRRNELGRTLDRGFSSKPHKLRMHEESGYNPDGSWTQRFEPQSDPPRHGGSTMRDPFNRPVGGVGGEDRQWTAPRYDPNLYQQHGGHHHHQHGGYGNGPSAFNGGGNYRGGNEPSDLNSYRSTFPRIDQKDPGSISYRPLGTTGPASVGYNQPANDYDNTPIGGGGGGGGGATYRSPPPQQFQPDFDSGYQGPPPSMTNGNGGGNGASFGGGGGGGAARGNDAVFPRKDDPASSRKPAGPRRELKGPNTAVAFTV